MDNPDPSEKILLPLAPPANDGENPRHDDAGGGRISKKRLQRERLILALLEQPSLAKAAASIGMSSVTAWRISKAGQFQQEYLAARRQSMVQASARLQRASRAAASKLGKLLTENTVPAAVQLRAAEAILRYGQAALQLEDLEDIDRRLKLLERKKKFRRKKP